MSMSRGILIAAAFLLLTAPAASAQQTITATGTAQVRPEPENRRNNASIRAAVREANERALPRAIANARARAAELATAAGVTLGPLLSISDAPLPGYPFAFSPQNGTFGNGRFCGRVPNFRTVVRNGVRRRVRARGTRRICRVPPQVNASVTLTFAVTS
jgi:hypothetical protein